MLIPCKTDWLPTKMCVSSMIWNTPIRNIYPANTQRCFYVEERLNSSYCNVDKPLFNVEPTLRFQHWNPNHIPSLVQRWVFCVKNVFSFALKCVCHWHRFSNSLSFYLTSKLSHGVILALQDYSTFNYYSAYPIGQGPKYHLGYGLPFSRKNWKWFLDNICSGDFSNIMLRNSSKFSGVKRLYMNFNFGSSAKLWTIFWFIMKLCLRVI